MVELAPKQIFGWIHRSFALHELKRTQEARDLFGREFHHARSEVRTFFPRLELRFDAPTQRQHLDVFLFAGGDVIQLDLRFTVIAQSKPTFSRAEMVTVWWLKLTHVKGVKC